MKSVAVAASAFASAHEHAISIREKGVSCRELAELYIERIHKHEDLSRRQIPNYESEQQRGPYADRLDESMDFAPCCRTISPLSIRGVMKPSFRDIAVNREFQSATRAETHQIVVVAGSFQPPEKTGPLRVPTCIMPFNGRETRSFLTAAVTLGRLPKRVSGQNGARCGSY
jgi:hypothetical protein